MCNKREIFSLWQNVETALIQEGESLRKEKKMCKTEDRAAKMALETFPILFSERNGYYKTDLQQERRNAYEKGYHQAEKDLALTWEDIKAIEKLLGFDNIIESPKEFYQEVLKRFKDLKNERPI